MGNKEKTIAPQIIAPSTRNFTTNTYFYSFSVTLSKVGKHILCSKNVKRHPPVRSVRNFWIYFVVKLKSFSK